MRTHAIVAFVAGVSVLLGCRTPDRAARQAPPGDRLTRAESDFARALAHYSAGMLHEGSHTSRVAAVQYARALELDPSRIELYSRIAADHLAGQEFDEAIAILRVSAERNPRSDSARIILGAACQIAGRIDDAAEQYRQAIRIAPGRAEGYAKLATLRAAQNRHADAVDALDAGMARATNTVDLLRIYEGLGKLYIVNRQMPEAIRCFRRISEVQPDNAIAQEILARTYVAAEDHKSARVVLRRLALLQPENGAVDELTGEVEESLGDTEAAIRSYTAAIAKPPLQRDPYVRLAHLQMQRDIPQAVATLEEAARRLPRDPLVLTFLGLARSMARRLPEAVEAFQQAERNAAIPDARDQTLVPMFYFWYGSACERSGRFDRAEELFERSIALYPDLHEAYNYLAYMWAERGVKLDRALAYVTKALAMKPDDPAYLDTLGWIYFRQGRHADALEKILEARKRLPDDPTILDHAGDVYAAIGKVSQAIDAWKRSLRLEPASETVAGKLRAHGIDVERIRRDAPRRSTPDRKDR